MFRDRRVVYTFKEQINGVVIEKLGFVVLSVSNIETNVSFYLVQYSSFFAFFPNKKMGNFLFARAASNFLNTLRSRSRSRSSKAVKVCITKNHIAIVEPINIDQTVD